MADQRPLANLTAIVTGASSGIGAATARELARRGARVALAARRTELLDTLSREITDAGGEAFSVPADVARQADLDALVRQVTERWQRVDILINGAGRGWSSAFARQAPQEISDGLMINLESAILLTRAVLPGMIERRRGHIVNIASVAGHIGVSPLYSATKFGLRGFSLALRRELLGTGVHVSVVSPGFIRTDMNRDLRGVPMPGPGGVANTIANLVTRPRREQVVPAVYRLGIWIERAVPGLADMALRPRRRGRPQSPKKGTADEGVS